MTTSAPIFAVGNLNRTQAAQRSDGPMVHPDARPARILGALVGHAEAAGRGMV
jgi:hypothetical protein